MESHYKISNPSSPVGRVILPHLHSSGEPSLLLNPPVLIPLSQIILSSSMFLLFKIENAIAVVLMQLDDSSPPKERSIYYVFCTLVNYKTHYSNVKELCLIIRFSTQ